MDGNIKHCMSDTTKKRILFITPYYPPEIGAPQSRISELAKKLKERGHEVFILCAVPNYPSGVIPKEYRGKFLIRQKINGIPVYRTYIFAAPNEGFLKRLITHLSFAAASFLAFAKIRREINAGISIVESPPLFMAFTAIAMKLIFGMPYIFNVSDVWPDSAVELGMVKNKFLIKCASFLEAAAYKFSAGVACVTRGIVDNIRRKNVEFRKVHFLPNGVDCSFFSHEKFAAGGYGSEISEFQAKFGLKDKFVVLYSGTIGISQNLGFLIDIAEKSRDNGNIHFLIVGDGAEREKLEEKVRSLGLKNVSFERLIPKAKMPALISLAGACVVSLLDIAVFRGALPSKMYEYMAMKKPILMFAAGECVELIEKAKAGLASYPGDMESALKNLAAIAEDKKASAEMGENAFKFVSENFSRDVICSKWEKTLEKL
jgi:glycosyltransferase involved in cell wall biosynthesis